MVGIIIAGALKIVGTYCLYGLVDEFDPHLISDEAVEKNKNLELIKEFTDGMFVGAKLMYQIPKAVVEGVVKGVGETFKNQ